MAGLRIADPRPLTERRHDPASLLGKIRGSQPGCPGVWRTSEMAVDGLIDDRRIARCYGCDAKNARAQVRATGPPLGTPDARAESHIMEIDFTEQVPIPPSRSVERSVSATARHSSRRSPGATPWCSRTGAISISWLAFGLGCVLLWITTLESRLAARGGNGATFGSVGGVSDGPNILNDIAWVRGKYWREYKQVRDCTRACSISMQTRSTAHFQPSF